MRLRRWLLALVAAFPCITGAASIVVVRVTAEGLNIRARPSAESDVVGYAKRGDTLVATIGQSRRWLLVRAPNGEAGYVKGRFVELVRVIAVEGDPVPALPSASAPASPCGDGAGALDIAIADTSFSCDDQILGRGVDRCTVSFVVEATASCDARMYRELECEARFGFARGDGGARESAVASAKSAITIVSGAGTTTLDVLWVPSSDAGPVTNVRLESGACGLR